MTRDQLKKAIKDRSETLAITLLGPPERKAGRELAWRNPFRNDKKPSLMYNSGKGHFFDNATNEHWDIFALAMQARGLTFPEAVEWLAREAGLSRNGGKHDRKNAKLTAAAALPSGDSLHALDTLAAGYGLTRGDFEARGCKVETVYFTNRIGKVPAVLYPLENIHGQARTKAKSIARFDDGHAVDWPAGKRAATHVGNKGDPHNSGFFPVDQLRGDGVLVIAGGEEKCLAAIKAGYRAVSPSTGEGGLPDDLTKYLVALGNTDFIVANDCDDAGKLGSVGTAKALNAAGAERVRKVQWSASLGKGYDLNDVLLEQGVAGVRELLDGAVVVERVDVAEQAESPTGDGRPVVFTNGRQFDEIVADCWKVALSANELGPVPVLYTRAGDMVYVRQLDDGAAGIKPVSLYALKDFLSKEAHWVRRRGQDDTVPDASGPPERVLLAMLEGFHPPGLPPLQAVLTAPVFGRSGRLLARPGYYRDESVVLQHGLMLDDIPDVPSGSDVRAAEALLVEALCDFPFANEADWANALALVIAPFVRRMIPGCTPMFFLEASTPRTGKGKIVKVASAIFTGGFGAVGPFPAHEEERRKKITSALLAGAPIIAFDNLRVNKLESDSLEALLTCETWSDRLLGASREVTVPNRSIVCCTGNNPRYGTDLAGRIVRIRLDAPCERPDLRTDFRHDPLEEWVLEHRAELVHAVLTLVQAWVSSGMPAPQRVPRMGGFEGFVRVVGGILENAGIEGFLGNRDAVYRDADADGEALRSFVLAWLEGFGGKARTSAELTALCVRSGLLQEVIGDKSEQSQRTRFGQWITRMTGRISGGVKILKAGETRDHTSLYELKPVETAKRGGCGYCGDLVYPAREDLPENSLFPGGKVQDIPLAHARTDESPRSPRSLEVGQ